MNKRTMAFGYICFYIYFLVLTTVAGQDGGYICPPGCTCTEMDQSIGIQCDSYQGNKIPPINGNVTKFIFSGSNVTQINVTDFQNATALHTLIIRDTPLKQIEPGSFDNMAGLRLVSIHDNALMSIPDNLFKNNVNMHELLLNNNLLAAITTKTFVGLVNLAETLDLDNNDISTLPDGAFDMFTKLERLTLNNNAITSVSTNIFQTMSLLSSLSLGGNKITNIAPGAFDLTSRIANLNLANNKLSSLPADLFRKNSYLFNLDLSNNNFTSIPIVALQSAASINNLRLDLNHITTVNKGDLKPLLNLEQLYLSYNVELLDVKAQAFDGLQKLSLLNMSYNPNLHSLDPNVFTDSSSLTYMLLNNNSIATFKEELFTGPASLQEADIHGNPIFCDCGAQWIRQDLEDQVTYPWVHDWSDLTCDSPQSMSGMKISTIPEQEFTCTKPVILSTEQDELAGDGMLLSALMHGGIPWSLWTLPDGTQVSPSGGPVNNTKTVLASGDKVRATEIRYVNFSVLAVLEMDLITQPGKYVLEAHNAADDITTQNFLVSKRKPVKPGISGSMIGAIIASVIAVIIGILLAVFLWKKMKTARYTKMDEPITEHTPRSEVNQSEQGPFDKLGEDSVITRGQRSYGGVSHVDTRNADVV